MAKKSGTKKQEDTTSGTLAVHRRARFDYEILERVEAGLVLTGTEIKSMRTSSASIGEGYARFRESELWLYNVHIAPYDPARENHEPRRPRKVLLHRRQLAQWRELLETQPRTTIVPLRLYLVRGKAKVELGLAMGKRSYDKRESIKEREADRSMQRALRHSVRTP
ncbi:MAG: SsrA-binding protein SmpB [Chloroflexi bacterium]|nr:SsrA-binding protein SmpB [Chloroflexota bacterium]MQC25749.1 SsrA-binding protein SmpB [Chloroflexota bacterium]